MTGMGRELFNLIGAERVKKKLGLTRANINYPLEGYTKNCQRCVPAWEARKRGWNVSARARLPRPDPMWNYDAKNISEWHFSAFKDAEAIAYSSRQQIERKMAEWGDGARAQIVCAWRTGGLQIFVAEQRGGKTYFMCPQTHQEVYDPFKRIDFYKDDRRKENVFARIDNLEFTDKVKLACFPL